MFPDEGPMSWQRGTRPVVGGHMDSKNRQAKSPVEPGPQTTSIDLDNSWFHVHFPLPRELLS